jgi:TPR repeat protein/transglutaminase-like putative cysteine protease
MLAEVPAQRSLGASGNMIARFCRALLLLLITSSFVTANAAGPVNSNQGPAWVDPGWRRTVARYTVSFDEQGLSTTILDFEIQALDDKGAEAIAQHTVPYNSYFDELSSTELATLKADGSVVAVDERAIRDQPVSADSSSPYFDERRVRIIAYPHVSPGDRIRGRLVYKAKQPRFAGEFARYWGQAADQPPEVIELTLDGPASKPLHIGLRNVEHREERSGERIVHHVRFRQDTPKPRQTVVGWFEDARRFEVSSFADYAAFAAMLNARNAPMARPDDALRKLSAEIVGDAADVSLKVERIHNWVARNIRYVGIGFEDGGWTSQPASAVLASRYGDCKAHATILKALLAAQGIEANLVAVNADLQYTLTEVATPNFDHAIAYVPAIDQYLDPTASLQAFGSLPLNLGGKPALNIDKGTMARIPVPTADHFTLATDTEYTLASDGTREARSVLSGTGAGALLGRALAQGLETVDRSNTARKLIEQAKLSGSGDYSFPNPRELSDSYAITATFHISKPVELGERARVRMLPLTDIRPSLLLLSTGGATDRAFQCRSLEYRETSSLTIPAESNFYEKPAAVSYRKTIKGTTAYGAVHGRIDVSASAAIEGRTIRSSATVLLSFDGPVCPAEFAAVIKAAVDTFNEFKYGPIGLTPKATSQVSEVDDGFDEGVNAFLGKSYKLAMTRLRPFAENGNARAQGYLGTMFETGRGVERDYREAVRWFLMAAEQGEAYSQAHLGYLYDAGLGVERDSKLAAEWYTKAADQGFAWAQMSLGLLYANGRGVPQDYTKAVFWLRNAAERNDPRAQYNLGWAYESGMGVAPDRQQAIEWYRKAAEAGEPQARARLEGLTGNGSFWGILFRHMVLSGRY